MRASLELHDLNVIHWVPGVLNLAEALNKRNEGILKQSNEMQERGVFNFDLEGRSVFNFESWV